MDSNEQSSPWAVVELFGHKTIAGQITKETSLFPLLRIDVPPTSDWPAYTVEYGPAAIYGITYVSEQVARATAESLKVRPINVYTPDLVTREQFEKTVDQYKQRIAELRSLPSPDGQSRSARVSRSDLDEVESGDDDMDDDDDVDDEEIRF